MINFQARYSEAAMVCLFGIAIAGCDLPRDTEGTLERVEGDVIRAGISENPPWTRFDNDAPAGIEPALLREFAQRLRAKIAYVRDSEADLMRALHRRELDIVICGLTDATPWADRVALTRPYLERADEKYVMAVPQGENRWLLELDRFLQARKPQTRRLLESQAAP